ncbi:MAG: hypothetical protein ABIS51_14850 [Sphingomonas sp.]
MSPSYDPAPDAITFLATRTPAQRHAIVRLLATHNRDARALPVLRWVIEQGDCDLTTAAMMYWRLRAAPDDADTPERQEILAVISSRLHIYAGPAIAWDGRAAWERTPLIGAPETGASARLFGPFGTAQAGLAGQAFLDAPYETDDIFDSLWEWQPVYADIVDWLTGKPESVWLAAIDDLKSSHPHEIYDWMHAQPECPQSVKHKIETEMDRPGEPQALIEDFDYWCARVRLGNVVPRPRAAAEAAWLESLWDYARRRERRRADAAAAAAAAAAPPGRLERLFYGGKFTGAQAQLDRCWRQFNIVMAMGAALLIVSMRGGAPKLAFWFFLALVSVLSVYQSSARMGGAKRLTAWWVGATALTFALTFVFRAIDGRG